MKTQTIIFGGGCFWCTEATFQKLKGVISAVPGYAGGEAPNPSYEHVCSGNTGHAEVIKIEFNPDEISFKNLLEVFFAVHDPTTLNKQGSDVGAQYRSIILYTSEDQKKQAEEFIKKLSEEGIYQNKIVTELKPLDKFYEAESYHHNYYEKNPDQAYCQAVINPKLKKLKEKYARLLK
ncbi:peptide-methionine (S)-S-oxide reductase MsrA [Candidatus Falkowbacteria bacterium]|nr:peptide-methionine (S)-S-oxide reductase MsrA [Candidatus Falkowbacteria bacterium]